MPNDFLQVRLEGTAQRPGHFTLAFDSLQYPVIVNPSDNVTFSEWLRRLSPVLSGRSDPSGELAPKELLRQVGTWLWQTLLPENAPKEAREALAHALRTEFTPLLLTLPDTLDGLPWELLCDPEQPGDRGFFARRRPLMRYHASATLVKPVAPPLRVLLLISSPPDLKEDSRVDVESERAAVEQATRNAREAGLLHLLVEDIVTPRRVQQALVRFKPHIVHYIGHGSYDEEIGGMLLWEDEQGKALPISATRLADMLLPRHLLAVVLHACETGRRDARTDVLGVADTLLKEGLPTVLAQQASFSYASSQRASEAWYIALTAGQDIASALFEVRQALTQADRPDWAVPILLGSAVSLMPMLDATSFPGPTDPLLTGMGASIDLPTPTGVFVGRHRELQALHLMLESVPGSGPILALITGPGGVGKSSLAAQAVTRYGRAYKAAFTLHCQGYQGVDLFLQRIGEFLMRLGTPSFLDLYLPDPKLSTEAKIEEAIAALNAAGPLLLVIDNLESVQNDDHTISDRGLLYLLQKLLTNLRGGRVLITGRYAVKDLLPQGKFAANLLHLDLNDLSSYETHQLLIRYPTLAALGEVVRQKLVDEFGGLPYVYDLLSSKAASQNLDLLLHDVQGRITQEHKRRTAEEWKGVQRQVVEFAALEAMVNRLPEASRELLAQLGVLNRPFPLAAIEEGLEASQMTWQPLLDWSLLHYDPHEKVYHLYSLTRHYAEGLLEEQARKQAQAQLAAWYERYALQDSHELIDVLEAHRLLRASGNIEQAGQLVIQLAETLRRYGLYPLLRDLCTKTLSDVRESNESLATSALYELGNTAFLQGQYEQARGFYQQRLAISERLRDQRKRASTLHALGNIAHIQGRYEEAHNFYQQSLDIAEQLRDQNGQAASLYQLGMIAQDQGKYEEAHRLYQQSLDIEERLGDQHGRANSLDSLANLAFLQEEYEEARSFYRQSLKIFEGLGDQHGRAITLYQLGTIAQVQGEFEEALGLYQQSLDIEEQLGNQSGQASSLGELGHLAYLRGEYEEAKNFYQRSLNIKERLGDQSGQATVLHQLGTIAQVQGKYEEAQSFYQRSLDIFEKLGDQRGRATSLYQLGNLAYWRGNFENALKYAIQAYIVFDALKSPSSTYAQEMITMIRSHMDEGTFIAYWQTYAGDKPLVAKVKQENNALLLEELSDIISFVPSLLLYGTSKQCQEFSVSLVEIQQRLPPEAAPVGRLLGYLATVLRGETPEVAFLEPQLTRLWRAFQDALNVPPNASSQQEEGKND